MGTDIHGYIEIREYNWWSPAVIIDSIVGRNYQMFGILFGVRYLISIDPIADRRGIPPDVSDEVKKEVKKWGPNAHSHSYVYHFELQNAKLRGYDLNNVPRDWKLLFDLMNVLAVYYGTENVRLVVWFDS